MTPREIVRKTILFQGADRLPMDFPEKYGSDFGYVGMDPSPDARGQNTIDEWGCLWHNIGVCRLGEVSDFPIKDWSVMKKIRVPDIKDPKRWVNIRGARERAGDKFLMGWGLSLYERAHFLRGLENIWCDIHENPQELGRLIDILVDMNLYSIDKYAMEKADGYMFCDDWGLQERLMINPDSWREIWKPRYAKVYKAAHNAGMLTFLHSCGHITSILDDLIEIGLDVIQMDQQENMGLDLLGKRFGGRITFWCPVDIQTTMVNGTKNEIRAYCKKLVTTLGCPNGGFMPKWYGDPKGAGHTEEAIDVMCSEFLKLGGKLKNLKYKFT